MEKNTQLGANQSSSHAGANGPAEPLTGSVGQPLSTGLNTGPEISYSDSFAAPGAVQSGTAPQYRQLVTYKWEDLQPNPEYPTNLDIPAEISKHIAQSILDGNTVNITRAGNLLVTFPSVPE